MQLALKKNIPIGARDLAGLIKTHYSTLMPDFYESQSLFLSGIYKRYDNIETALIFLCYARNTHLQIIRKRETNLNYDVSLSNFLYNLHVVDIPSETVGTIVNYTGIPKETVRRKIKNLFMLGFLQKEKVSKKYFWIIPESQKNESLNFVESEIKILSKFISRLTNFMNLNLSYKDIEKEIKSQYSFYWYHFLSCELEWLKLWQAKLKDIDLILIILQTIIPTLQFVDKNLGSISLENVFKLIGKAPNIYNFSEISVSAAAVSEVTGIPRATCMRKLNKLTDLSFLKRDSASKRYYINQNNELRTRNIMTQENVSSTIETFTRYFSIIINAMISKKV